MKKLTLLLIATLALFSVSAQETVKLIVSGQGATKEEATANALRSAIEQSFGVFVSANTQILNDEVVKDEIATIASGNIQEYKELACITLPNGNQSVSLSATVSIGNLISYAKSKGSSAEFAGQVFAMNMKMRKLNAENEIKALYNMLDQFNELAPSIFNWELKVGDPIVDQFNNNGYVVPMTISAIANESSVAFHRILMNTLRSISLSPQEREGYDKNGMRCYSLRIGDDSFVLRNDPKLFVRHLNFFVESLYRSFRIKGKSSDGYCDVTPRSSLGELHYYYVDQTVYDPKLGTNRLRAGIDITGLNNCSYVNQTVCSYTVNAELDEQKLFSMQGFEITHDNVSRLQFQIINNIPCIEHMTIYQNYLPQYIYYRKWKIGGTEYINSEVYYNSEEWVSHCQALKSINIVSGVSKIEREAFEHYGSLESVVLGSSVEEIDYRAFAQCHSLKQVIVHENLRYIREGAFISCSSLENAPVDKGVESIGNAAFCNCSSLKRVSIGKDVKLIGEHAFAECRIESVIIPMNVKYIDRCAFDGINKVVFMSSTPPNMYTDTCPSDAKIYVPLQAVDSYKSIYGWMERHGDNILGHDISVQ